MSGCMKEEGERAVTINVTKRNGPHWPQKFAWIDDYICLCGYRETDGYKMLCHVETWNPTIRYGPLWAKVGGTSMSINRTFIPGHAMIRFQNVLRPTQFRVKCSCGFATKYRSKKGGTEGRLHVEEACCTILGLDAKAVRKERRERRKAEAEAGGEG